MTCTRTAILTVLALAACGNLMSSPVPAAASDPPSPTSPTVAEVVEVSVPRRFVIELVDGERRAGPWLGFDLDGARDESGIVPWQRIRPADRLRLGRELIRSTEAREGAEWGLLLAALELSEAGEMASRARSRLEQIAGPDAGDLLDAVSTRVEAARAARHEAQQARDAATVRRTRPHLEVVPSGVSAVPAPRPARSTAEVAMDRAGLRDLVESAIDGLGLELVPTAGSLAGGAGTLESVAAIGVELDRCLDACRIRLGGRPDVALPGGGVAILTTERLDDARLLAAASRVDWPVGESSLLLPKPEGWIALVPPVDPERRAIWSTVMPAGKAEEAMRLVEVARLAGRVAMLEAGDGRVPGWLVEGFAEAAAQGLVPAAPLERLQRAAAVAVLRSGRSPRTIVSASPECEDWGPEGDARRVSHLLVTRLLESDPGAVPGIVAALRSGASIDTAFRRWTGLTLDGWFADSVAWYRTND